MAECLEGTKATCSKCSDTHFLRDNNTATEPCCTLGIIPEANACGTTAGVA